MSTKTTMSFSLYNRGKRAIQEKGSDQEINLSGCTEPKREKREERGKHVKKMSSNKLGGGKKMVNDYPIPLQRGKKNCENRFKEQM